MNKAAHYPKNVDLSVMSKTLCTEKRQKTTRYSEFHVNLYLPDVNAQKLKKTNMRGEKRYFQDKTVQK